MEKRGDDQFVHRGRRWAAASARTLARRLIRSRQHEVGYSRAQAAAFRAHVIRQALLSHWQVTDGLGAHFPLFGDTLKAARLTHLGVPAEAPELLEAGNWARHSPPPGAQPFRGMPREALRLQDLERFRAELFAVKAIGAVQMDLDT